MNSLSQKLIDEVKLAVEYKRKLNKDTLTTNKGSSLALAYERARNAVEYRDEHLIRQAAIERILTRRLFLNQTDEKIANSLYKELVWARYIDTNLLDKKIIDKLQIIIKKYRQAGLLVPNSTTSKILTGICACEIDEILNFDPINQIIINYVTQNLNKQLTFEAKSTQEKELQIYIAVERGFAKNSEMLIRYKLLKVLLPKWDDSNKLLTIIDEIENHLNHEGKDHFRRKVIQLAPPFNLIRDFILENQNILEEFTKENEKSEFLKKIQETLELKYKSTRDKLLRASKRSIVYIFLTKMIFALLIEIPFDMILGSINYVVLSINILFPPSLMILFSSKVSLPNSDNTKMMIDKVNKYVFSDERDLEKEEVITKKVNSKAETVFYYLFLTTSIIFVLGIVYFLSILNFNFMSQIIFLFFLSVVSFFAFRVREISKDYLLTQASNESFFETLTDYLFLPIIKIGQWLSTQVSKINILSFIFDFIIEAPLKTFLEIFEQWLHFVRVKKEEFLG